MVVKKRFTPATSKGFTAIQMPPKGDRFLTGGVVIPLRFP